jgi:hypothetical protein
MKPDLAILYEHPKWFEPLFAALDRRGVRFEAIRLSDHSFDPDRPTSRRPSCSARSPCRASYA